MAKTTLRALDHIVASALVALMIGMVSCTAGPTEPTPMAVIQPTETPAMPTATATIAPTSTPRPTDTPQPTDTPRPTPTNTPRPTATSLPEGVLFTDDFSSSSWSRSNGWSFRTTEEVQQSWSTSKFIFSVKKENWIGWNMPDGTYDDFGVEIEAEPGSEDTQYGIVFRSDGDNVYFFGVTTEGEYFLKKIINDEWAPRPVDYTHSQYIKQGQARNTLSVLAEGSEISLYLNGFLVKTISDDSIAEGAAGLFVGSDDIVPVKVVFGRFTVFSVDKAKAEWGTTLAVDVIPTSTPRPAAPAPTAAPKAGTYISVRNTFPEGCRIVLWGPADITIGAGPGATEMQAVQPGTYGWKSFVGGRETGQADNLVVPAGATCSFWCDGENKLLRWGCY